MDCGNGWCYIQFSASICYFSHLMLKEERRRSHVDGLVSIGVLLLADSEPDNSRRDVSFDLT